ncbi:MAG: EAL domain-containing protein [Mycobacterium sp.]|nr:EAL domain-containing protein [Mycobacterium sp.]
MVLFATVFATVLVTYFAWHITKNSVENSAEQDFLNIVNDSNDAITQRMLDYTIALDSGVGLLRSSDVPVTRTGWKKFTDSLKLRTQFAGIQGLGYAVIVPPDEKLDFERKIRAEGFPDFAIKPPGDRDPYSAIVYLEPFDFRNQRAFGFDMYSEPIRREAMQSAARTGLATVSGPVTLVQETDEDIQRGFLMYVPHYREGAPTDTVEQREAALIGWVYAAFRTRDLLDGVLPVKARNFYSEIFYGDGTKPENLLYESPRASDFEPERTALSSIPIGNRTWTSRFTSGETASARSSEPWIVAGAGLVIDVLLFLVIASLALRRQRAEELALQMTADLRTSNTSLVGFMQIVENSPNFVAIFDVNGSLKYLNQAWRSLLNLADNDPLPNTVDALFDGVALDRLRDVSVPAALREGNWSGESTLAGEGDDQVEVSLTVLRHEGASEVAESWLTIVAHDITAFKDTQRLTTLTEELRRNLTAGDDPMRCIQAIGADALAAVKADGLVARVGRTVFRLGDTPDQDTIDRWVRAVGSAGSSPMGVTDCLATDMPELAVSDRCAGAIVARLPGTREAYMAWFRRPLDPIIRQGDTLAPLVATNKLGRRRARASVDAFPEDVHDHSRPWSDEDRTAADMVYRAVQSGLIEYSYRQLAFEATIDPLTGLGNRRALAMTMDNERRSSAQAPHFSLLFIDLDRFKQLNDAFGHEKGDLALRMTSTRLKQVTSDLVGRSGIVFRLGGDEFVVLLRDVTADDVARLAKRLVAAFREPLILSGSRHVVNVSVGAVVSANGATETIDADELLRRGDLAMYSAKRAGGSRVAFYQDSFSNQAVHRLKLEQELYRALSSDELAPAFQPIVSIRTGQIIGAEALARWHQPEVGILEPSEFIQLAEETGQIRQLDRQIAERAVLRCRELLRDSSRQFHLAINVSAKTFDAQYISYLSELIERYTIPAERLTIELTESAMVGEASRLQHLLVDLRALGVRVAIDDFGTGYSSLAYLQSLPADMVKLDRTFVDRLRGNPGDDVVARWAIQLVSDLGMTILAEGVETAEQEQALRSLGYDWAQGYRYGKPMREPPIPGNYSDVAGAPPG